MAGGRRNARQNTVQTSRNLPFFPLTAAAERPATAVEEHQTPPQVTLPSRRRLVNPDGDSGESHITDPDPGRDPFAAGP